MTDRRAQKGLHRELVFGKADRPGVAADITESQRPRDLVLVSQQIQPLGQIPHSLALLWGHTGGDEVAYVPRVVKGHKCAVASAGRRGALGRNTQGEASLRQRWPPPVQPCMRPFLRFRPRCRGPLHRRAASVGEQMAESQAVGQVLKRLHMPKVGDGPRPSTNAIRCGDRSRCGGRSPTTTD